MGVLEDLTPYMRDYSREFADSGDVNWLPYLMYFHPAGYHSKTVSTDTYGFRYSEVGGRRYAVTDLNPAEPIRLIAGSSTVFGIGASADRHTLASRLTENDKRSECWVNFGGRSFNSTQELMLFTLNRHRLPPVAEIVLFSGFNDLGLARLPASMRLDHGAFFMCQEYFDAMANKRPSSFASWLRGSRARTDEAGDVPTIEQQIAYAANLTLRNLDVWRALAADLGAQLTFVLQPLANWVRSKGAPEEERLFAELERRGAFAANYGDILAHESHQSYSSRLRHGSEKMGVRFVDFTPLIAGAIAPDQWLFVDRIHFTDSGHDIVSKILLNTLS